MTVLANLLSFLCSVALLVLPQFNEKALAKHSKICKKVFQTKRKAFDAQEVRLKRVEAGGGSVASEIKENIRKNKREELKKAKEPKKPAKWKAESNRLRTAMAQSRACAEAERKGLPPPPMTVSSEPVEDNRTPCPHCGRSFNEQAAARHIPKCADMKHKVRCRARFSG